MKWINVNDKLPEKNGEYIVGHTELLSTTMDWDGEQWISDFGPLTKPTSKPVTHWMPLPAPPNG